MSQEHLFGQKYCGAKREKIATSYSAATSRAISSSRAHSMRESSKDGKRFKVWEGKRIGIRDL